MNKASATASLSDETPLNNFSDCHAGIISRLNAVSELPTLLEPAMRVRTIAEDALTFLRPAVFDHHVEEEKDLFPAVLANAANGEERDKVQKMVDRLKTEHRHLEAIWVDLEPQLKKLANGKSAVIDVRAIELLVRKYTDHAKLEEEEFLPLSEKILGRNSPQLAALGLSLHIRHAVRASRRGIRGS